MTEEVKSFPTTQMLPFISHRRPAVRSHDPSERQYALEKNGHRNQHKGFLLRELSPFVVVNAINLKKWKKTWKNSRLRNVKGGSMVLLSPSQSLTFAFDGKG